MSSSSTATNQRTENIAAIKANCKKAYDWLRTRDEQINNALAVVESMLLHNNSEEMHHLYLKQLQSFNRGKCIATYTIGKEQINLTVPITDSDDWTVQITRKQKVRVVPSLDLLDRMIPADADNIKMYN
jgi:hypothetical protein